MLRAVRRLGWGITVCLALLAAQAPAGAAEDPQTTSDAAEDPGILPGRVFEPLQAGVRWPRFSASHMFVSNGVTGRAGIANMGGTLPFFGGHFKDAQPPLEEREAREPRKLRKPRIWEAGLHAGVFALFEMDRPSQPLTNADYLVGPYFALREGRWSGIARLYHQSSHLGDEFLLANPAVQRIDLHWELLELVAAFEPNDWLRVYTGGGALVRRSQKMGRGQARIGAEARSTRALFWGLRPVGAIDLSWLARSRWRTNVSLQLGLEMRPSWWPRLRLQWMAEYYGGAVPDGQFLRERTDRYGSGLYVWL